jgi:predicted Zn-dependent peptidase
MALDMLSQLLIYPLLSQKEIERERLVILEEIKMREDDPQIKVEDRMVELLFQGSGLGLPGTGTPRTVTSFKHADFLKLKKQHYVGGNIVLVLAGNLGKVETPGYESLQSLVSESFCNLPSGTPTQPQIYIENHTLKQIEIIKKSTDQIHLSLGFRGYSRKDNQRYAQGLLSVILGSGFTSRLFQKVRQQKSLAYSIGTDSELFTDTGLFAVQAGVDQSRLPEAIETIWDELKNIRSNPSVKLRNFETRKLTSRELRKAKDYLRGKLVLRLEDPLNLAMYYGGQQLLDNIILTWEQVLEQIEKVTIPDIEQAADHIFNTDKMSLVVIGNGKLKLTDKKIQDWFI